MKRSAFALRALSNWYPGFSLGLAPACGLASVVVTFADAGERDSLSPVTSPAQ